MKVPQVSDPSAYQGLYVFDFGEWVALGYTAREIAMLLESETYRDGKVYRIVRATPDGRMELQGVPNGRFEVESGMFFNRRRLEDARADLHALRQLAEAHPPPCRAFVHLADRGDVEGVARYVTALIYPAEYDPDVSRWLLVHDFAGGDTVEGGISHVTNYDQQPHEVLERVQLWSADSIPSRSQEEVFASVRRAVQR